MLMMKRCAAIDDGAAGRKVRKGVDLKKESANMSKKRVEKKVASPPSHTLANLGRRRLPLALGAVVLTTAIIAAIFVWSGESGKTSHAYALAPESALPAAVRRAPSKVQEAYRFAIANRDTLGWIPCFCGCGAEGHTSNADCYIKDVKPDGSIEFDSMSLG